jgi:hypothetical protein
MINEKATTHVNSKLSLKSAAMDEPLPAEERGEYHYDELVKFLFSGNHRAPAEKEIVN